MNSKEVLVQVIKSRLASLLSILFSPFIVPTVAILLLVRVYAQTWVKFALWTSINVLFVNVLPFLYIYICVKLGKLTDIHVVIREQRKAPLLFLLIPLVAWARIQRKRHTLIQTLAGAIIAVIVTKLTLLKFVKFSLLLYQKQKNS